jgi:hypothetical protein
MSQLSRECGSLDVSQPYGPPRLFTGIPFPEDTFFSKQPALLAVNEVFILPSPHTYTALKVGSVTDDLFKYGLLCDSKQFCINLKRLKSVNINLYVRFEVFSAVTMKKAVFWDVAPCRSGVNRRFGGMFSPPSSG